MGFITDASNLTKKDYGKEIYISSRKRKSDRDSTQIREALSCKCTCDHVRPKLAVYKFNSTNYFAYYECPKCRKPLFPMTETLNKSINILQDCVSNVLTRYLRGIKSQRANCVCAGLFQAFAYSYKKYDSIRTNRDLIETEMFVELIESKTIDGVPISYFENLIDERERLLNESKVCRE